MFRRLLSFTLQRVMVFWFVVFHCLDIVDGEGDLWRLVGLLHPLFHTHLHIINQLPTFTKLKKVEQVESNFVGGHTPGSTASPWMIKALYIMSIHRCTAQCSLGSWPVRGPPKFRAPLAFFSSKWYGPIALLLALRSMFVTEVALYIGAGTSSPPSPPR